MVYRIAKPVQYADSAVKYSFTNSLNGTYAPPSTRLSVTSAPTNHRDNRCPHLYLGVQCLNMHLRMLSLEQNEFTEPLTDCWTTCRPSLGLGPNTFPDIGDRFVVSLASLRSRIVERAAGRALPSVRGLWQLMRLVH